MCALTDYAEKLRQRSAKFRPYAPRNLDDAQREKLKAQAVKEGIAPKERKKKARKRRARTEQPTLPGVN